MFHFNLKKYIYFNGERPNKNTEENTLPAILHFIEVNKHVGGFGLSLSVTLGILYCSSLQLDPSKVQFPLQIVHRLLPLLCCHCHFWETHLRPIFSVISGGQGVLLHMIPSIGPSMW